LIRFAKTNDPDETATIQGMWRTCFSDPERFIDFYFEKVYRNEYTILAEKDNQAVASLQMLPYKMMFFGSFVPTHYISGACTMPAFRRKHYMRDLLTFALRESYRKEEGLSTLIPGEPWLFDFYKAFGYRSYYYLRKLRLSKQDLEAQGTLPGSAGEMELRPCCEEEYARRRWAYFADRNLTYVLSTENLSNVLTDLRMADGSMLAVGEAGFAAISRYGETWIIKELVVSLSELPFFCRWLKRSFSEAEYYEFHLLPESNLFNGRGEIVPLGMARTTNAEKLLKLFAKANPHAEKCFCLVDPLIPQNNGVCAISSGKFCFTSTSKANQSRCLNDSDLLRIEIENLPEWLSDGCTFGYMNLMMN
jgi:predicted acetyltransferase